MMQKSWGPVSAVSGYFPDIPDHVPRSSPPVVRTVRRDSLRSDEARETLPPRERAIVTRLVAARQAAGLTQMDLALKMACSKFMISMAETGRCAVGDKWTSRVLAACGLPADWTAS